MSCQKALTQRSPSPASPPSPATRPAPADPRPATQPIDSLVRYGQGGVRTLYKLDGLVCSIAQGSGSSVGTAPAFDACGSPEHYTIWRRCCLFLPNHDDKGSVLIIVGVHKQDETCDPELPPCLKQCVVTIVLLDTMSCSLR